MISKLACKQLAHPALALWSGGCLSPAPFSNQEGRCQHLVWQSVS